MTTTTTTIKAELTISTEVTTNDTMTLEQLEQLTYEQIKGLDYNVITQFTLEQLTHVTGSKAVALSLLIEDETQVLHKLQHLAIAALFEETCSDYDLSPLYQALGNVTGADKLLDQLARKSKAVKVR